MHNRSTSSSAIKYIHLIKSAFLLVFCFALTCFPVLGFSLLTATPALGADIPLSTQGSVRYNLVEEPLSEFLPRFFSDNSRSVILSDKLLQDKRTLNGPRQGSAEKVFRSIEQSNALASYYDGNTFFIYKSEEIMHQFYTIDASHINYLRQSIHRLNSYSNDKTNHVRIDRYTGLTEVNGVPRYIDRFRELMRTVVQKSGETVFRYYPLKYAWATDRTFTAGGKQVTIPGVASILKEVIYGASGPYRDNQQTSSPHQKKPHFVRTRPNSDSSNRLKSNKSSTENYSSPIIVTSNSNTRQSQANIVADPQHNAIIIRDTPDRIPLYEDLLASLDIPTKIIEIEATIIDVNIDKLKQAGVEWRYGKDNKETMFANPNSKTDFLNALGAGSVANLNQIPGFQLGAIIGDRKRFITRVNMLESQGVLSVSSRPRVATLNNLEAVIESSRSLFVPVSGAYDAELFEIFSGTVLKVTPHVIETETGTKIRLIVSVEDGSVDTTGINGNPVSTRNAVSTQAMIQAGHSLLLGGLVREQQISQQHKVPLLGDIPLLGRLFKSKSTTSIHTERLFLISPRLLSPNGSEQHLSNLPGPAGAMAMKTLKQQRNLMDCEENCNEVYDVKAIHQF
ncbi:MAG: type III secretion system outer membrane ring subunit SctC [Pseudomonadales bacterium]|nr:type III secretion system outer membrane ring subunit SctC [Pseudomonadales bacterium]